MTTPLLADRFRRLAVDPSLLARYRLEGSTTEESIATLLRRTAARWRGARAVVEGTTSLDYGTLLVEVERVAGWLVGRGVRPGDVVTWQLPNWWEAHVVCSAVWYVGAVNNPVSAFAREHELRHILVEVRPAAVIAPRHFRGCDHVDLLTTVLTEVGIDPEARLVVRGEAAGWDAFDQLDARPGLAPADTGPDDLALVMYTSGTTSNPKGVVHSARTLLAETRQITSAWGWSYLDTSYAASPLSHMAGLLRGVTCPMLVGATSVLADRWDAELALAQFAAEGVTIAGGPTVFLQEVVAACRRASDPPRIRLWPCGGAPVPPDVVRAAEEVGIPAFRIYGMSELPTVSLSNDRRPFAERAETDGVVAPGVEVRVVDEVGRDVVPGAGGQILVRGPEQMLGYLDAEATAEVAPGDGWIRTGDLGTCSAAGVITVTGRVKDIVNRGGEKISARELEELLTSHTGVAGAAVVAAAHRRFGEVPAAFLVLEPGASSGQDELARFLQEQGLPRQKVPEHWFFVEALPMTASGTVNKRELSARCPPIEAT